MGSKFNGESLMTQGLAVVSDGINSGFMQTTLASSVHPTIHMGLRMAIRYAVCKLAFVLTIFGLTLSSVAAVTVSILPRRAPLTLKQKQQFKATVSGTTNTGITWLVDGIVGGSSTVGTISTSGLYTPPS